MENIEIEIVPIIIIRIIKPAGRADSVEEKGVHPIAIKKVTRTAIRGIFAFFKTNSIASLIDLKMTKETSRSCLIVPGKLAGALFKRSSM